MTGKEKELQRLDREAYAKRLLKVWFPWLGTDDDAEGADVIASLGDLYDWLDDRAKRNVSAHTSDTRQALGLCAR